jgi:hypothetical protein
VISSKGLRCISVEADLLLQVPQLIAPLGQDTERVLNERHYDEESSECRDIRLDRLSIGFHHVLHPATEPLDPAHEVALTLVKTGANSACT